MEYLIEDIIDLYTSLSTEQKEYADKQIRKTYGKVGFSCCLCEASILPIKDFEQKISFVCGFDGGYPSQICKIVKDYKDEDGNVFEAMVAKKEFYKIISDAAKFPAVHISEVNQFFKKEYDLTSIEKINTFLNVLYYKVTPSLTYDVAGRKVYVPVNEVKIIKDNNGYMIDFSYVDAKTNKKYWPKEFQTSSSEALIKLSVIKTLHMFSNNVNYKVDNKLAKDKKYWKVAIDQLKIDKINSHCSSIITGKEMAKAGTFSLCDLCKNKCKRSDNFNLYPKQTIVECAPNAYPMGDYIKYNYDALKKKIRKRNILTVVYSMLAIFIAMSVLWCTYSYDINFDCGIGTPVEEMPDNYNFITGDITLPELEKAGYNFIGWYDNPEFIGDNIDTISMFSFGDKSFYAKFEAIPYPIIYHLDGGDNDSKNPTSFNHDQTTLDLFNPVKMGYTFKGWYDNSEFNGNKIDKIKVSGYEAMNLYAKWEANDYIIYFDYQGATGENELSKIDIKYDSLIDYLPAPIKKGHYFTGWINKKTSEVVEVDTIYNFDEDIILVATWAKVTYSINLDTMGGQLPIDFLSATAKYEEIVTTLPIPTRVGYTFIGWVDEDGNYYINNETVYNFAEDITLYAVWEANKYTITFEYIAEDIILEDVVVTYDEEIPTLPHPLISDKIFLAWKYNDIIVKAGDIYLYDYDITLTAWCSTKGIKFDYNSGSGLELERDLSSLIIPTFGTLPTATKEGYEFVGWYYDKNLHRAASSGDRLNDNKIIILYAAYKTNISFDYQGATGNTSVTSQDVYYGVLANRFDELPVPVKTGYRFAGWYTGPNGTGVNILDASYTFEGSITVYAKWVTTIYFIDNDRTTIIDQVDVVYGNPIDLIEPENVDGFEFKGWYHYNDLFNNVDPYTSTGEIALTPVWIRYVSLNYNDADEESMITEEIEVTYLEPMSNLTIEPVKDGYKFVGWYSSADITTAVPYNNTNIYYADYPTTLYAMWVGQITYYLDGVDNYRQVEFYYGNDIRDLNYDLISLEELSWPYLTNLEFVGWRENIDSYELYEFVDNYKGVGNIYLHAMYYVDVTYEYNGATGNNEVVSNKVVYQDDMSDALILPEKTGYSFINWYYDAELVNEVSKDDICSFKENITIYAKWEANSYTVNLKYTVVDGEIFSVSCTYDSKILTLPVLHSDEHIFIGWKSEDGKLYNNGDIYDIPSDTIFTSEFRNYGLAFYSLDEGVEPHISGKIVELNQPIGQLPLPIRMGYTFLGWYDTEDNLYTEDYILTEEKIVKLYSKWTENSYTIHYDYNGGTGTFTDEELLYTQDAMISYELPTKTGYIFLGWDRNKDAVDPEFSVGETYSKLSSIDGDIITFYALWAQGQYLVTFNYNGGIGQYQNTIVKYDSLYPSLPTPTKEGYTFGGWYLGSSKIDENTMVTTADAHTLDAEWIGNRYTVTYGSRTKEVTFGEEYGLLIHDEKVGYDFIHWEIDMTRPVFEDTIVKIASDHELRPIYQAKSFTVKYNYNGGTGKGLDIVVFYNNYYGDLEIPTRTNYNFIGWEYNGKTITNMTTVTEIKDHTLTAVWEGVNVTVKFNYNGGSGSTSSKVVKYGGTYGTLPSPSSYTSGDYKYTFSHWTNSNGTKITSSSNVTTATEHTLKANWTKEEVNTECFVKGSLITMADGSTKKVEDLVLGEEILVFNHETGMLDTSVISYIFYNGYKNYKLLNLYFADGVSINVLFGHGFFDRSLNEYVVITPDNVEDYIGHEFYYSVYENGSYVQKWLTLDSYGITFEYTECYSVLSAVTINHFVNGMLAVSDDIEGLYNIFKLDENMKVIEEDKLLDLEIYGKFTYDDWKDYVTYEEFVAFNAQYLKVSIGKGLITYENLMALIERFL